MTTTEQINYLCSMGERVVVKDKDGDYCIFSTERDYYGNFRHSNWWGTIEEAKQHIGAYPGYTKEEMERLSKENEWQIVDSYIEPIPVVPKGTKVLIKDCAKSEVKKLGLFWSYEKAGMLGKVCEVKEKNGGDYKIWNEDKSKWFCFPRTAFTLWTGKKEEENFLVKNGEKYLVKIIKEVV